MGRPKGSKNTHAALRDVVPYRPSECDVHRGRVAGCWSKVDLRPGRSVCPECWKVREKQA